MTIAVLADSHLREDILFRPTPDTVRFVWADSLRSLGIIEADVYMDLEFQPDAERIRRLRKLFPAPVIVNAVVHTSSETDESFIRINAWPGLLRRPICELALGDEAQEETVRRIFDRLGWQYQLVADTVGMVTPRILAAMVNEAWRTLGRSTNTQQEIDRLLERRMAGSLTGPMVNDSSSTVNDPSLQANPAEGQPAGLGPFAMGRQIGLEKIYALLRELARLDPGVTIAPLLLKELDLAEPDTFH